MISNAFRGAYTNQVAQQTQGINNITQGVKDVGVAILGSMGFGGMLGEGAVAKGAQHTLAGRIGGVGGNIMLATLNQKKDTAQVNQQNQQLFTKEDVSKTIQTQLGDNPINRAAIKQLNTVFDTLQMAKEQELINKKGQIESSLGDIDPNSELGKQILQGIKAQEKPKKEEDDL